MLYMGIEHPSIACHDVVKLADWYCQSFAMKVVATNGKLPPALLVGYGGVGDVVIEMMPATDPGPEPATIGRFAPGIRHIAIRVSNFEEAYARLKSLGVKFTTEPGEPLAGGKTVLFRDPEGNELQIVQRI